MQKNGYYIIMKGCIALNILVFSFSPKNETSITYHSVLYLQKIFKEDNFDIHLVGGKCSCTEDDGSAMEKADLVMLISSLFHFSAPHQMMLFLDDLYEKFGDIMKRKTFVFYTTSGKIMDITIHGYVENYFNHHGLKYERSLSQFDCSILEEEGRAEIVRWFTYIKQHMSDDDVRFKDSKCKAVVFDLTDGSNARISKAAENAEKALAEKGANVSRVNLRDYKILGCNACYGCYTTCVCVLNKADELVKSFEDVMKDTDIVFYVGELHYGMLGPMHKAWLDRQVQFGRRPFFREKIFDFLLDTDGSTADDLNMFKIHTAAMGGFGGDVNCCIGDLNELDEHIRSAVLIYNNEMRHQQDFYGVGVDLKFKRLAVEIQNMAVKDYEYFKSTGAYKPVTVNPNIAPVYSGEDSMRTKKGRLVPYRAVINDADTNIPDISVRTRINGPMPLTEYVKPDTKKFGLFSKKSK